jgi:hypothetical protein
MQTTSAFSRGTISVGVPAGAARPNQESTTKSETPASAAVGTSGSCGERSRLVTRSPFT